MHDGHDDEELDMDGDADGDDEYHDEHDPAEPGGDVAADIPVEAPPAAPPAEDPEEDEVAPVKAPRDLRAEAKSREHLLTHKPYNPYCEGCRLGKMSRKRRKSGALAESEREINRWGQLITSDHMDSKSKANMGLTGSKEAFLVIDLWSRLKNLYATPTKNTADTQRSIDNFKGDRKVSCMYADRAGSIAKACRKLRIRMDTSLPGLPRNNSVVERCNQTVTNDTRAALVTAGLPACF